MPDSPALSLEIRTAAAWRLGTVAMTVAAALCVGGWGVTAFERGAPGLLGLALPAVAAIGAAASMRWIRAGRLDWDGETWRLTDTGSIAAAGQPGTLAVALDGGGWMLLRFRAMEASARRRTRWLALSRRDLRGPWHALRCAVYSPRPDPAGRSAQAPAAPSA